MARRLYMPKAARCRRAIVQVSTLIFFFLFVLFVLFADDFVCLFAFAFLLVHRFPRFLFFGDVQSGHVRQFGVSDFDIGRVCAGEIRAVEMALG